jgi:formate dehydrogenase subunit gamma
MSSLADYVERFTLPERITHILLFSSLIVLSLTGLTLKYHESAIAQWFIRLEGGVLFRGKIHRLAAIVLMLTCAYHVLSIMFSRRTHEFFQDMLITRKDFRDFGQLMRYNLGLTKSFPQFGRFSVVEKFQYWAAGVFTVLLTISGVVLWFETLFMMVFPKWVIDLTHVLHSFEATVGFLVLVVWHLYNVHLNPQVFPMSKAWLTGRISREDLRRDHPLEYKRLYEDADR